jgi:multidrug resistance efflux pump
MRNNLMIDLAESTDVGQALQTRVPRIVHSTTLLLLLLLAAALAWMALTRVNLVVRAIGRVRPATSVGQTFDAVSNDISSEMGGRVVEVRATEGDAVKAGDVLMRIDTERVENQIEQLRLQIHAGEEERTRLEHAATLLAQRYTSARRKAEAELVQARHQAREAEERRAVEIRLAKLDLEQWEGKESRTLQLAARQLISAAERLEVSTQVRKAREKWHQAQLPLNDGRAKVLEHALELVQHEYEAERNDLAIKRQERQARIDTGKVELATLRRQRTQSVVRAPTDGIVTKVTVKVGDIIQPGKVGLALAPQRGFEFEAVVGSEDVAHLQSGMPVRIKLDALPYQKYGAVDGTLRFVAPDSEINTGTAIYRVKIALPNSAVEHGAHHVAIMLGMTGQAEIITGQESILMLLVRRMRQTIS